MSGTAGLPRRFCQALDLVDSPALIEEYQRHHQRIWPEIAEHLREHGILIWRFTCGHPVVHDC